MWPHLTPRGGDFNKLAFVLCQKAFISCKFQLFWSYCPCIDKILKIFSCVNTCKTVSFIVAPPDPRGR
jgi:hypothetical protein